MEVRIPMAAIGKERARSGPNGHYTPRKTAKAEEWVALEVTKAMRGAAPLDGPISMTVQATYAPPASWSEKRKRDVISRQAPKITKPDVDNIAKLAADACNGIAYLDDKQIADLSVGKNYGPADELRITIRAWPCKR